MGDVGGGDGVGIDTLCAAGEARAARLGHRIGPWEEASFDGVAARVGRCARCDAVVYVRLEQRLAGLAGEAVTEQCRP